MRVMAGGTALTHRLVFKNHWTGLFPMTLRATFIEACHGEATFGLHDIAAMWVVALDAIHPALYHGMVLGQAEFRVGFQMTLKARSGVFAGIEDQFCGTTGLDM